MLAVVVVGAGIGPIYLVPWKRGLKTVDIFWLGPSWRRGHRGIRPIYLVPWNRGLKILPKYWVAMIKMMHWFLKWEPLKKKINVIYQ